MNDWWNYLEHSGLGKEQKGHKKLKRAEPQTHLNGLPGTEAGDGDAAGHGYREGVQRQAHGNQENLNQTNHLSAKYC